MTRRSYSVPAALLAVALSGLPLTACNSPKEAASAPAGSGGLAVSGEHPLDNGWAAAGQPSKARVQELAKAGVTIISLRAPSEDPFNEEQVVKEAGGTFIRFPVSGATFNDPAAIDAILDAYAKAEKEGKKVYVHCASSNRVGATWALYQAKRKGVPADQALAKGKAAGLRSLTPIVEKALAAK